MCANAKWPFQGNPWDVSGKWRKRRIIRIGSKYIYICTTIYIYYTYPTFTFHCYWEGATAHVSVLKYTIDFSPIIYTTLPFLPGHVSNSKFLAKYPKVSAKGYLSLDMQGKITMIHVPLKKMNPMKNVTFFNKSVMKPIVNNTRKWHYYRKNKQNNTTFIQVSCHFPPPIAHSPNVDTTSAGATKLNWYSDIYSQAHMLVWNIYLHLA